MSYFFFFSSRRRHTRFKCDWSSDVCSSDLNAARAMLSDEDLEPRLRLDHELELAQLNVDLLRWHEMLQPFGNANQQPLFFARAVEPAAPPRIMKDKHLVLRLRQ